MQPSVTMVALRPIDLAAASAGSRAELNANLIARAQQGDRDAQRQFLRRYAAVMHQLVRRVASDRDPDALTQALLARLLEVLPRFKASVAQNGGNTASLTTWVFSVAHHFVIDELRRAPPPGERRRALRLHRPRAWPLGGEGAA